MNSWWRCSRSWAGVRWSRRLGFDGAVFLRTFADNQGVSGVLTSPGFQGPDQMAFEGHVQSGGLLIPLRDVFTFAGDWQSFTLTGEVDVGGFLPLYDYRCDKTD